MMWFYALMMLSGPPYVEQPRNPCTPVLIYIDPKWSEDKQLCVLLANADLVICQRRARSQSDCIECWNYLRANLERCEITP